jgi:hypothetical protein
MIYGGLEMDEMQGLLDRAAIAEVLARLGALLDGHGGDAQEVYDRDVVVRSPRGEVRGIDAVIPIVTTDPSRPERTQHLHADLLVTLDGDRAVAQANELVHFFHRGEAPHRSSGLRVQYRLVRRPEGWRIVESDLTLEWIIGELPPPHPSASAATSAPR